MPHFPAKTQAAAPAADNQTPWTAPGLAVKKSGLSATEINQAIAVGSKGKGREQGLVLVDVGQTWVRALDGLNTGLNGASADRSGTNTGFKVVLYTPIAWIRQHASDAAKEFRTLTAENVTDDLTEPVLRVIVFPDTPTYVIASGFWNTSSVQHAVLRDSKKRIVVQPVFKEPFTEEVKNAMGGAATFQGMRFKYLLDDVRELRGSRGDQEFLVTVVGSDKSRERDFVIKRKHFEELP